MKKGDFKKLVDAVNALEEDKIIGFIGRIPVIERRDCPPGIIYALNMDDFNLAPMNWQKYVKDTKKKKKGKV